MSNDQTDDMKACMDEVYARENRERFNDLLDELIDACADYREAEQPGSGHGSWTRSQLYAGVLRSVRDVVDAVNQGAVGISELGVGGTSNNGGGGCVPGGGAVRGSAALHL